MLQHLGLKVGRTKGSILLGQFVFYSAVLRGSAIQGSQFWKKDTVVRLALAKENSSWKWLFNRTIRSDLVGGCGDFHYFASAKRAAIRI